MALALTDEQAMIRDAAADVLAERSASADVRRAIGQSAGRDDALWAALSGELGWNALALPETAGGMGLGAVEQVVLMEQLGRRIACVPYFSTACVAATALADCTTPAAHGWLAKIAAGACSATLALPLDLRFDAAPAEWPVPIVADETAGGYALSGAIAQVIDGARADLLLVPARIAHAGQSIGLFALDAATASGLTATPLDTLDATRPIARIVLDEARVGRDALLAGGDAARVLERAAWFAALALAAEQLGGAQQCLDLTLDYTGQRVQFGRAIASFQAVKHRCAQMMVLIESARSAVLGAAHAWDAERGGAALGMALRADVAAAKAAANDAYAFCAQEAIQLHGGVGFTWEYDPHLYFKRAQASGAQFGSTPRLLEWIAHYAIDGGAAARDAAAEPVAAAIPATVARPSAARAGALQ
ncbi:acyl-CoA dehydrogenase family protein [Burkholderia pseudomultivorans]|uniref:Acyl-CoA dehydrogenase FadE27 n=1 Tax=Burkholderia pseudomultivorans TaxID=1207504 RepID=A0ABU2E8K5_9BURK|nr:acyl-CoA dehydrogenase family protein [Burkholderia pseudomultivorans]MDR8726305.1 Acyl-CoA dehydrogenase FadE27 [Burkholderia pseudomultivorans]MDR8733529.1 Acyl-CoA dehydrogenase FadE27 [Burkholderia pseudomultivorans]MDR8740055.1 Acyl-CoA dehydrogenase FadE27 [Burkholderia pseudomultivorans]MDR8756182.1 Acyl-CoA dehydrogenase FadE27 [Burkholderia pseudomultivorans]MDR8776672.1 Acyl-CoA dehydrogenase FadE27 [Burkholderia pseudomultivorans]